MPKAKKITDEQAAIIVDYLRSVSQFMSTLTKSLNAMELLPEVDTSLDSLKKRASNFNKMLAEARGE